MDPIAATGATTTAPLREAVRPGNEGAGFASQMREALSDTNQLLQDANQAAEGVADGSVGPVEAVLSLTKAELSLRHAVSMTTRALEAYREVMRLQL